MNSARTGHDAGTGGATLLDAGTRNTGGAGAGGAGGGGAGGSGGTGDAGSDPWGECGPPEYAPLAGRWRQEAEIACGTGEERVPEIHIEEVIFEAGDATSGTIDVTWIPFETYVDYWGTYASTPMGPHQGTFSFQVDDGNQIPEDMDSTGTYRRCGDELFIEGAWFGTHFSEAPRAPACGYRFRMY